jgi:hypothetical protein
MKAISLFDFTGNILKPHLANGWDCTIVDIQHPNGINQREDGITTIKADLTNLNELINSGIQPADYDFVAAFPPCDHLAVSGAAWFKGKGLRKLAHSIQMFATAAEFCEIAEEHGASYFIENPISTISTYWREPDYKFDPYWFTFFEPDDNYTKNTCLWAGKNFKMPAQNQLHGLSTPDNRIHSAPPGPGRKNFRSKTPMGFARAVYAANWGML